MCYNQKVCPNYDLWLGLYWANQLWYWYVTLGICVLQSCTNYDPWLGHHLWSRCVTLTTFVQMVILGCACTGAIIVGLGVLD